MAQMEEDLGTSLDWVAVDHFNTGHPHSHIMLFASPDKQPSLGEAARAGAEVLLPEAQGSDAVLKHLEEAIGELPVPVEG